MNKEVRQFNFNVKPFDGKNFTQWKVRILALLEEFGVSEVIYEEAPASSSSSRAKKDKDRDSDREIDDWKKKNTKAKSILIQHVADSHLSYVADKRTAREIWETLVTNFQRKSIVSQVFLRKKLISMKLKENTDLTAHFVAFDEIINQLRIAGGKINEIDTIVHLFITLPPSYNNVVTSLETLTLSEEKDLTLEFVKARLFDQEVKLKNTGSVGRQNDNGQSQSAFITKFPFACHNCGRTGHRRVDCRKPQVNRLQQNNSHGSNVHQNNGNNPYQGGENQRMKNKNWNHKQQQKKTTTNNEAANFTNVTSEFSFKCTEMEEEKKSNFYSEIVNVSDDMYLDSGASKHMFKDKEYFANMEKLPEPSTVEQAGRNDELCATEIGKVRVESVVDSEIIECNFENSLFVPGLREYLISIYQLDKNGARVTFENGRAMVSVGDKIVLIGTAIGRKGLYKLINIRSAVNCLMVREKVPEIWHRRLGHLSYDVLQKMVQTDMVDGIDISGAFKTPDGKCEYCVKAKQHKLPHNKIRNRGERILEIVHMDICGPISPVGLNDEKYILTVMDDYSHFAMCYLLTAKSEAFGAFKQYEALVTSKFNQKISVCRCDNGGEFTSNVFKEFCAEKGIRLDYTIPYTPELNGKAERLNRTLLEKTRALLFDSTLPKYLWPEAVKTATYLLNRTATKTLENCTPAEIWHGIKPNMRNLRVYGCKVFAHTPSQLREKLDEKSKVGHLVGYVDNGYRIWFPSDNSIISARDVTFDELKVFENHQTNDELTVPDPYEGIENVICDSIENIIIPDEVETSFYTVGKSLSKFEQEKYNQAMAAELTSMKRNDVWDVVDRPVGESVISSKWDLRQKHDGTFKARLVARGFEQNVSEFEEEELYSPVAKMPTVKTLLSIANKRNLHIHQMDVCTAFLNAELDETVFMEQPPGFNHDKTKVCRLKKAIYGLKKAPKLWNECISEFLKSLGFSQSKYDSCLYMKTLKNGQKIYILIYVDDVLIVALDLPEILKLKQKFNERFEMSDLGEAKHFLGLEITRKREDKRLYLCQTDYIDKVISRFSMNDAKTANTPMEQNLQLEKGNCDNSSVP